MSVVSAVANRRHVQIGERIRQIRLQRKFRQIDLAEKAGLSWRHLIRMERGEGGEPRVETLDRIADALGVRRSELTGDEDDEESDPVAALMAALRRVVHEELDKAHV